MSLSRNSSLLAICLLLTLSSQLVTKEASADGSCHWDRITIDATKMAPYRALAKLTHEAFANGDMVRAQTLARILEMTWDRGEANGGAESLVSKRGEKLTHMIDDKMDAFIKPIIDYQYQEPHPARVNMSYQEFLQALNQAD
jgi:hypothetical protein